MPGILRLTGAAMSACVLLLATACSDSSPIAPAVDDPASVDARAVGVGELRQAAAGRGIDAEFARLAKEIPGFGGMYYDRSGKLNVYMKGQPGAAAARAGDVVGGLRSRGAPAVRNRLQKSADVAVQAAQYDYGELLSLKSRLSKLFGVRGVVYTDIDEAHNRLRIGITPATSQRTIEQALAKAGIPKGAVLISRISPIKKLKLLTEQFRPVPGGVQIFLPAPSIGPNVALICTLGFNAKLPGESRNFFVTASHCSDIQGGNQQTPYFQPRPGPNNANKDATEFKDPQYGSTGGLCDAFGPGFRCRLSDALLSRYDSPVGPELGKLARTTFGLGRIGSLEIDSRNPRWTVVEEFPFPFEGEVAHKVGRSSGWTTGPVILTCVDVGVTDTDIIQICQDIVLAGVRPGDSGSPVFARLDNGSSVALFGVLWGGGTLDGLPVYVFSSMEQIEFELGQLNTFAGAMMASAQ